MTSDKSPQLSEYQYSTLTQMGIPVWKIRETIEEDVAKKQQSQSPSDTSETHGANELPPGIAKFKSHRQEEPAAVQKSVTSIPDAILMTISDTNLGRTFVRDVLIALNLDEHRQHKSVDKQINEFSQYRFAWCCGDNMALAGNVLTTPDVLSEQHKKQLWQLIANYES